MSGGWGIKAKELRHGTDAKGQAPEQRDICPTLTYRKYLSPSSVGKPCRQFPPEDPNRCVHPKYQPAHLLSSCGKFTHLFFFLEVAASWNTPPPQGSRCATSSRNLPTCLNLFVCLYDPLLAPMFCRRTHFYCHCRTVQPSPLPHPNAFL